MFGEYPKLPNSARKIVQYRKPNAPLSMYNTQVNLTAKKKYIHSIAVILSIYFCKKQHAFPHLSRSVFAF